MSLITPVSPTNPIPIRFCLLRTPGSPLVHEPERFLVVLHRSFFSLQARSWRDSDAQRQSLLTCNASLNAFAASSYRPSKVNTPGYSEPGLIPALAVRLLAAGTAFDPPLPSERDSQIQVRPTQGRIQFNGLTKLPDAAFEVTPLS